MNVIYSYAPTGKTNRFTQDVKTHSQVCFSNGNVKKVVALMSSSGVLVSFPFGAAGEGREQVFQLVWIA